MEECNSFLTYLVWDKIKPVGSHTTTNRRQEQEFRMTLKRGGFAGLLKKSVLGRGRGRVSCEGSVGCW
jgi:hypothetical protein